MLPKRILRIFLTIATVWNALLFLNKRPATAASLTATLRGSAMQVLPFQGSLSLTWTLPLGFLALVLLARRRKKAKAEPALLPAQGVTVTEASKKTAMTWPEGIREIKAEAIIGRDSELEQLEETLAKQHRSSAVLVGPSGAGKSAVIRGFAQRIAEGRVGGFLRKKTLVELDMAALVAGTKYRGDFEEKMLHVLKELASRKDQVIVVIEDIDQAIGTGSTGETGSIDVAGLLRPWLMRGDVQLIGTVNEGRNLDKSFLRLFNRVNITKCDEALVQAIVAQRVKGIEDFHDVKVSESVVDTTLRLTDRYMAAFPEPDRSVDVLDTAAARAKLRGAVKVTEDNVRAVIAHKTKIPIDKIGANVATDIKKLEENMRKFIIGQAEAIDVLIKAIARSQTGLKPTSLPVASFLFAGHSGCGKTEIARQLAKNFYGKDMIRIDMSEFMEAHAVSRLIGTSAGYIGYGEGGNLTEAVKHNPHSLILLDEVEKAHPKVFDLFLQVLGDGRLTDGRGEVVDFKNVIIIMTTNIGAQHGHNKELVEAELSRFFRPEFRNRLDDVVIFNPLQVEDLGKIYELILNETADRMRENFKIRSLRTSSPLKQFIIERGFDPKFGARPLRRAIQRFVDDALAEYALVHKISENDEILLDLENDKILVRNQLNRKLMFRKLDT